MNPGANLARRLCAAERGTKARLLCCPCLITTLKAFSFLVKTASRHRIRFPKSAQYPLGDFSATLPCFLGTALNFCRQPTWLALQVRRPLEPVQYLLRRWLLRAKAWRRRAALTTSNFSGVPAQFILHLTPNLLLPVSLQYLFNLPPRNAMVVPAWI